MKAPFPISSSRMLIVSSSASRLWMTMGSPDMRAAAMCVRKPCLGFAGAEIVMVVEACLADADHPGVLGEFGQEFCRHFKFLMRIVRMRAYRAKNIRVFLRDAAKVGEFPHARRDRDHEADASLLRARQHGRQVLLQPLEVEVAMAVDDEHRQAFASSSTKRGKMGCGGGRDVPDTRRLSRSAKLR